MNIKMYFQVALKNLKRSKVRTFLLGFLIVFLTITLFMGSIVVKSLQKGLDNYKYRLGADVIVVPYEATTKDTVNSILLEGITGNYYMGGAYYNKIKKVEGIEQISAQFYLTSAKASCCSVRVQIIGFDPETDFSIKPWIEKSYSSTINDGDIVVGSGVTVTEDRTIRFYGKDYNIVGQLASTGTGLDNAVYTNMNTIKQMAESSNVQELNPELTDVDIETAVSAVFIKVKDGYSPEDVALSINTSVKTIKASTSASMVSNIGNGLDGISIVIGILIGIVWVLAFVILIITFTMISNERKKEFAILRLIGSPRKGIGIMMAVEGIILSAIAAVIGIVISVIVLIPLKYNIKGLIDLPFLLPNIGFIVLIAALSLLITIIVCMLAAYLSSKSVTKSETGLLLREDA